MRGSTGSGRRGATWRTLACLLASLALVGGCGGGGDAEQDRGGNGADTGTTQPEQPGPAPAPAPVPLGGLKPDCLAPGCAALAPDRYAGAGVGIWKVVNDTAAPVAVPLSVDGLSGQDVTLVFTNTTLSPQPMSPVPLTPGRREPAIFRSLRQVANDSSVRHAPDLIREFNRVQGPALLRTSKPAPPRRSLRALALPPAPGTTRTWSVHVNSMETREATLVRTAERDGVTVNLWLEDGEAGPDKMSDAILDGVLARFFTDPGAIYRRATALAGAPWGTHPFADLIGPGGPIDIVLVNFDHDQEPYGLMGYFWSYNNFQKGPSTPDSNESLSLYLDTETFYRSANGIGLNTQYSTLAHEFMHMVNFYQRGVLLDNTFDTWMEELSALMLEDVLADGLTPGYSPIRDGRFPDYLNQGAYNCSLLAWDDDSSSACFSYSIAGTFGGYLLRQYGIGFFRQLLRDNSSTDSIERLDSTIRRAGGPGMAEAVRRSALSAALLPAIAPGGFGLPERLEEGITLVPIDGTHYRADRVLPPSVPAELVPLGSFPVVRQAVRGTYAETVTVPPYTTLSVVIN